MGFSEAIPFCKHRIYSFSVHFSLNHERKVALLCDHGNYVADAQHGRQQDRAFHTFACALE